MDHQTPIHTVPLTKNEFLENIPPSPAAETLSKTGERPRGMKYIPIHFCIFPVEIYLINSTHFRRMFNNYCQMDFMLSHALKSSLPKEPIREIKTQK
jgi:hypothetical protein